MRRLWALFGVLAALCCPAAAALAHPLGNFTINHYSRIEHSDNQLRIFYVLDMAEIPTFQERPLIDAAYPAKKAAELASGVRLKEDGQAVALTATDPALSFLDGQGGLQTLRLTTWLVAPLTGRTIDYEDTNAASHIGWREIVVAPAHDVSNELKNYPTDMLTSPLDQHSVHFSIAPGAAPTVDAPTTAAKPLWQRGLETVVNAVDLVVVGPGGIGKTLNGFTGLISAKDLSLTVIIFSLLASVVLGALHGLSPGHGKTIVGAYLVGARGTGKQALFLGVTVTATHTIGVFALGLVTLFASRYILPEQLYPWLGAASGIMVAAIGLGLFVPRLRRTLSSELHHHHDSSHGHTHDVYDGHASHDHTHRHDRGASPGHRHEVQDDHSSSHTHDELDGDGSRGYTHDARQDHAHLGSPRLALAYAGARVTAAPSDRRTFRMHTHEGHTHEGHTHEGHTHEGHTHEGHTHEGHAHEGHTHEGEHAHQHTHSHGYLAAGQPGSRSALGVRQLLGLGISGGLLPCPSALVVLLSAISLHQVGFGMILIVAFSIGLAGVLTGIGLLMVYAGSFLSRFSSSSGRLTKALPAASALVVFVAGLAITVQGLSQAGVLAL